MKHQEVTFETPTDPGTQNLAAALTVAAAGFPVFPCDPNTKAPLVKWKGAATTDHEQIENWWKRWPDAMPGLPTGSASGVSVVDLDMHGGKNGVSAARRQGLDPQAADLIVRTARGGLHLYYNHADGARNSVSAEGLDVRGEGGYVIAPGAVGKAGAYVVEQGDLWEAYHLGLSQFPDALFRAIPEAGEQAAEGDHDIATLREALFSIPNDGSYEEWVRALMALHHETRGSDHGLALAHGWSAGYRGYSRKEIDTKWRSFGHFKGPPVTSDTLFAEARRHGWKSVGADYFDDDEPEESGEAMLGDALSPKPAPGGLTFLTPEDCEATAGRPYVVKGLLAQRDVAALVGAPGAGKSVLGPALAYAVAQGREFHGRKVRQGSVFYVAAEDETGMRGRVAALRREHGAALGFRLVCGVSDLLNAEKGGQWSPHAKALARAVKQDRPALIVIDTLAMAFPGLEENSAEGMGRVVSLARRLTRWGAAVLLIHHDTKDGKQGLPRGHSILNGALDVAVHIARTESGVIVGRPTKNRNGPMDADLAFRIAPIELARDEDGDPVTAPMWRPCEPGDGEREPRLSKSQRAALDHLYSLGGEDARPIPEDEWRKACVDGRAVSAAESADSRGKAFRRAARELVTAGVIAFEGGCYRPAHWAEGVFDDE